ncbi:1-phosphofructokinase [Ethanoligenens harbinense]|uniref:Tagatose-6-phosphate kinase n=1 Tax=Ethanoligenens harbinense (strain DSM 18485 / JCM 12961 / CGMCC 1.5033 / YUAN-3) TaxID=663278 RepID=E6U7K0_ETHHY|nr:1-phosphofructokinase [Ethanoligenens harbinense]ADU27023.1 1-phosphofructokinase [Ethanoligenens harbinense YUAN-3]AVQ96110.1 1-phosphofructokinase [Ethanoligenens harbinense YUAN-3]AYF38771.1 1-phosphofructokinase [Ethanoligenens harbinense]AYF41519.1 1-phosphofructokinase [Ethanoligenens harbinense]QCN92351.1 1-phosphofructokinase [Ethanoligenens harbinense]
MAGKVIAVTVNPSIDKTIAIKELVPYGLNRVMESRLDPGGKGINVARVLHSFETDVVVTGFVAGNTGKQLLDFLSEAQLPADCLEIPGETRTNLKVFDRKAGKTTEINESGAEVSPENLEKFQEKFRNLCKNADVAVVSGSLPPGVPKDFYAQCITAAKVENVKTILDADGEALAEGLKSIPYAVKPNIHELEALLGRELKTPKDVLTAAREFIAKGIAIVIVSMGPDGALVADADEAYKVDSWDIEVKSATGAGDSMVGSLAYSIVHGDSLYDIAKITTAAGTITASKPGTQICTKPEVLDSLHFVTVTKIEE